MKKLLLNLINPKGWVAPLLLFTTLSLILIGDHLGFFAFVKTYLDADYCTFQVGAYSISIYEALRSLVTLILVFWVAAVLVDFVGKNIKKVKSLTVGNRALFLKLFQIFAYIAAFLVALQLLGIDVSSLTLFGSALGIGIGFGLQKVASNFISGLILSFEKTIEEDDLIELADGTVGFVRKSFARYTLVETFDNKEVLIPNEDFITHKVTNLTLSDNKGRIEISLGVGYESDLKLVEKIILESANEHAECLVDPAAKCYLRNFGASSIDFTLHLWISDVSQGRWRVQSEIMMAIWDKFKAHKISVPYPQREILIKNPGKELSA